MFLIKFKNFIIKFLDFLKLLLFEMNGINLDGFIYLWM